MINPDTLRTLPPQSGPVRGWSFDTHYVLEVGYRPFFLLAALVSAALMLLWALALAGVAVGARAVPLAVWHGHEMLWGYGGAVLVGFLLTAVRNWTRQSTPSGRPLAVAAGLWLVGRVAMALPGGTLPAAVLELAAWGIVVVGIGRAILMSRNSRNYPVLGLTVAFALSDVVWHLPLGPTVQLLCQAVGLATMATLLVLVGGRIIPFFTSAAIGSQPQSHAWIERSVWPLTLAAVLAFGLLRTGYVPAIVLAALALAAALVHGVRLWLWWDRRVLGVPLLWVLHAGYGLLVLHFGLSAAAGLSAALASAALHTLTAGGLGLLTVGMLARVSLGHGGRPLHVGPRTQLVFGFVALGAVLRVAAALLLPYQPQLYRGLLVGAASFWVVAFVVYVWLYGPVLTRAGRAPVE